MGCAAGKPAVGNPQAGGSDAAQKDSLPGERKEEKAGDERQGTGSLPPPSRRAGEEEPTTDIDERTHDGERVGSSGQEGDETEELRHPPEVNGRDDVSDGSSVQGEDVGVGRSQARRAEVFCCLHGPPGSIKGKIAELLIKEIHLSHLSPGEAIRHSIKAQTAAGLKAQESRKLTGKVPEDVQLEVMIETLRSFDASEKTL
uniref:Adenylate kinase n=1 Tax=Guillardia theta TaxID=55529 RepID=A0A7S4NR04_GUITH|mmetsp:Transcript_28851/g.93037  ORF Transcript_28851/g.93037 Transcript_28851/m.93037 type:complete len:201 (+) Transcript_28851:2-604(+)